MPRCCSVYGCKSNYLSEKKKNRNVSTFTLPKEEPLRSQWLHKIPTDFSKLKNPIVCIKHFHDSDVIRIDRCLVKGEYKEFPRIVPKLRAGAIPKIFHGVPKYLSSVMPDTSRRLADEQSNFDEAVKQNCLEYQNDQNQLGKRTDAVKGKEEAHISLIPSASTSILSFHFINKDFVTNGQTVRLSETSIPSIFPDFTDLENKSKEKEIISNSEEKIADSLNDNLESPILNETESKIEENGIQERDKIKSESAIKRKPKYSELELEALVSGVENKRDVLIKHGMLQPLDWKEITEEVNTLNSVQRTSKEIRVKWKDLRAKVKTKAANGKHGNFSAIEERIFSLTKFTAFDRKKGYLKSPSLEELQNSVADFKNIDLNHSDNQVEEQDYPYECDKSFNELSSPSPIIITPTEIQLLVKQQEQLLRQQGQILRVLEEFRDIQKEIFSLKQKNYQAKLMKFQITTKEDADVEFVTETESS